ncbi:hypothetical protein [Rhizobium leguminosarum]|uniref:hypothetical protein n=1 Tax=Rhizobium leguminosarum TaxID=384 RepID=UPI00143F9761|nr:hypothetical protein [Rhizobium leguminosarum]NKL23659.1 hypothetical protein [Rhizobium leguminosarum bv. viciae]
MLKRQNFTRFSMTASLLLAAFSTSAVAQTKIGNATAMTLSGTCDKLVIGRQKLGDSCDGKLLSMSYPDGRVGFSLWWLAVGCKTSRECLPVARFAVACHHGLAQVGIAVLAGAARIEDFWIVRLSFDTDYDLVEINHIGVWGRVGTVHPAERNRSVS